MQNGILSLLMNDRYTLPQTIPEDVSKELGEYSELVRTLLYHRGITTRDEAHRFLHPDYETGMHDPSLMKDMPRAVARVLDAIERNERIVVYGDYDCDGIPGSVILSDFFEKIGFGNFSVYIPHRHKEGYGLHSHAIDTFVREGVNLVITVDCGIASVDAVERANKHGIDVIVTDHHIPPSKLPAAYAILNPKVEGCAYPDKMLCGAGVAWKFVYALLKEVREKKIASIHEGWEKWLLDMAGLATIADMVPLMGENRVFAHFGLKVLRKSPRPGLQKLLYKARVSQRHLTETDVGFTIAPRINAASRMDDPNKAFQALSGKDAATASAAGEYLHTINDKRKLLVARIVKEVKQVLAAREEKDVVVVGNPKWKVGVLGIVANTLMEELKRPVFIWGREEGMDIKGSCRSDGSVNIVTLMESVPAGIFANIGGHELAGGFSVVPDKIHLLEEKLIEGYASLKNNIAVPKARIDSVLTLSDVNWNTYREIERLSPFGVGNPKPIFLFENVTVKEVSLFGKEKHHLKIIFSNNRGVTVPAVKFFAKRSDTLKIPDEGSRVHLVAEMEKSLFGGRRELRLRIIEIFSV